jgi:hypothetical protein
MSVTIKCSKCGAENRLGQLFCRECGDKLDLSQAKHAGRGSGGGRGVSSVALVVRLVIFVALLTVLGLLCWGVPSPGAAPSENGATAVKAKLVALRGAVLRKNDVVEFFDEADVNAYLNASLTGAPAAGGFLKTALKELALDIRPGEVTVWMKSLLGPLPLTYVTDVKVSRDAAGRVDYDAGTVRIGRLPMPGFLKDRMLGQFIRVFSALQEEQALINRLGDVRAEDGAISAATVKH